MKQKRCVITRLNTQNFCYFDLNYVFSAKTQKICNFHKKNNSLFFTLKTWLFLKIAKVWNILTYCCSSFLSYIFIKKIFPFLELMNRNSRHFLSQLFSLSLLFSPSKKKMHRIKRERAVLVTKKCTDFQFIFGIY